MRRLVPPLALILCMLPALAAALPTLDVAEAPRQGDVLVVRLDSEGLLWNMKASLRFADGKQPAPVLGVFRSLDSGGCAGLAFIPLPMHAPTGAASLLVSVSENGQDIYLGRTIAIKARDYASMDIKLTPSLTDMKEKPDPVQEKESRFLTAILYLNDPEADYLDGPFIRPIQEKAVSATYGDARRYIYAGGGSSTSVHTGLDLYQVEGVEVKACGRGKVVMAQKRVLTGNTVVIEHESGLYSLYYHMQSLAVKKDDIAERGQVIGKVGATGFATGPHLHWELRLNAEALDPESLIGQALLDKILPITTIRTSYEGR